MLQMYSLGLIFFEMSYPLLSGMERAMVLEKLRVSPPSLPPDFQPLEKNHSEIILSLVDHDPGRRPSSSDLLSSGQLPVQMETESIKHALEKINDASTPYFVKNLEIMTSRTNEPAKDYAWDLAPISSAQVDPMREYIVMDKLISIFRRHGAVPGSRKRPAIYPRSSLYGEDVVKVVERGGLVLQLPYDLMLGHARALAKAKDMPVGQRLYCFGYVFRDRQAGNQPVMMAEVDFDIVTTDALDLGLREAETIKVLDEIITAFPSLSPTRMSFQLGHSDLLQFIFDYCGVVSTTSRTAAAEVLSKLGSRNFTWQKARIELRSAGLSVTSVDELQRFDFRGEFRVSAVWYRGTGLTLRNHRHAEEDTCQAARSFRRQRHFRKSISDPGPSWRGL